VPTLASGAVVAHSGGRRAYPVLWRAVNPNFGASFAARAVVPAQRTTPLRALGGTSRDRAFPITDPRIPMANANRKAPALVMNQGRSETPIGPDEPVEGSGATRGRSGGGAGGGAGGAGGGYSGKGPPRVGEPWRRLTSKLPSTATVANDRDAWITDVRRSCLGVSC
jgi:hypothetical protein